MEPKIILRPTTPADAKQATQFTNLARHFPRTSPEDFLDNYTAGHSYIGEGALVEHHLHPYAGNIVTIGCEDTLIADCLDFTERLQLGQFSVMVADKFPALVQNLGDRGFRRVSESICQTLDFRDFDANQKPQPGYDFLPLQELSEEAIRSLYELEIEVSADVPNFPISQRPSFEDFLNSLEADRANLPYSAAALQGGQVLAVARHVKRHNGCFVSSGTGVRREARGLGLARATKIAGLHLIHQAGGVDADTSNDIENPAMLHINRQLGYRPIGSQFLYRRV